MFVAPLYAQELISNDYEKGYVKDGKKYLVWDYFDYQKELELKINHTTGKIYFLKEDTTNFTIYRDGKWIEAPLKVYPIPVEGYQNFYNSMKRNIRYPATARRVGIDGDIFVMFEIDTAGVPSYYLIIRDIGGECGEEVVRALREVETPWLPAHMDKRKYRSRFILPVTFALGEVLMPKEYPDLPAARQLRRILITALGVSREEISPGKGYLSSELTNQAPINTFHSIEEAIASRKKVQRLVLTGYQLKELSPDIGLLENLQFLDLERNELSGMPNEIGKLAKLEELYLPENELKNLPSDITLLKSLRILGLAANRFTEFPKQICACTQLEVLDIGDNQISEIPACIGELKKLKVIGLQNNHLKSLPDEFYALKKMQQIFLKGNPLEKEIVEKIRSTFRRIELVME